MKTPPSKAVLIAALAAAAGFLCGCSTTTAVRVRPWERAALADETMNPDRDPLGSAMSEHVLLLAGGGLRGPRRRRQRLRLQLNSARHAMKLPDFLKRRRAWASPAAAIIALLQRFPAPQVAAAAEEFAEEPAGRRSLRGRPAAAIGLLGAVDSVAGATLLANATLNPDPDGPLLPLLRARSAKSQ